MKTTKLFSGPSRSSRLRGLLAVLASVACAHAPPPKPAVAAKPTGPAPDAPRLIDLPPAILYKESRELMAQGRYDEAEKRVQAYLKKEPKSAAARFDAGWLAEKRGDAKAAQADYEQALANEPAHLGAALNLARLKHDDAPAVEKILRTALKQREGDPQLLDALAPVLRKQGKLDEAEAAVRKVLERHPRDADAYRNLAAIEADRGHVRLAESALNNARKLDEKDAGILNSLGLLALKRDDAGAARADFEQATQLDASFAPAWANLGALALSYRDYAAAEQAYAKAVQLDGTRWDTRLAHGWALEGLKKFKDARGEYEKVLAMKPAQEDALFGRAVALKAEGDLPGALQAFKEYAANSKATHVKEAQTQIASIDMRLKNPPLPKPAANAAALAAKPAGPAADAELDLSKLPQGTDTGPSTEKLPTDEGMGPGAAPPPPAEPAKVPEKTDKNPSPPAAVKSAAR